METRKQDYCVYVHYYESWTNPFYVGMGNLKRPFNIKIGSRSDNWSNRIKKDGKPNVKIVSYFDTKEAAALAEISVISYLKSKGVKLENVLLGGIGALGRKGSLHPMYGLSHTQESRNKMSESLKGLMAGEKNPMYGMSGEKNPMYGKNHSEEAKKKQSEIKKGVYVGDKNPFYGKKHTEEYKEKARIRSTGIKYSEESRIKKSLAMKEIWQKNREKRLMAVPLISPKGKVVIDINTGVFYYSLMDAEKYYPFDRKELASMLNGEKENKTSLIYAL